MIEARVRELAGVFAVGVYAYAWMANHFHLALAVRPDVVRAWSDEEVVERWQRVYRSKCEKANAERRAQMSGKRTGRAQCTCEMSHINLRRSLTDVRAGIGITTVARCGTLRR